MNRIFLILSVLLVLMGGCESNEEDMNAPQNTIDKANAIVDGTITKTEAEIEDGVAAWKVEVRTSQGAEVEIYCRQDNLELISIEGDHGPFDYNATPGMGLIDFDQAKAIGAAQTSEDLMEWELEREDDFGNQWVYELEYTLVEIYINANDGSILEISS